MNTNWLERIKRIATAVAGLKRYWKVIVGFLKRVSQLEEEREARQIQNMKQYLDVVAQQLKVLKDNGCSNAEIKKLAQDLNVPLIQANLEAMIITRQMAPIEHSHEANPESGAETTDKG